MADRSIARRYARAFIELAEEAGAVEAGGADLDRALAAVRAHDDQLLQPLSNPVFTHEERSGVLQAVVPKLGVGALTRNLLFVLLDKGRFGLLPEVVQVFHEFADEKAGRVRVLVQTAAPLTPQLETEVIAALEKVTGKDVIIETQVDERLIGGIVARVGSVVYDASIRTRIENIKQRLLSTRTPAQA
jgi:F-type H+-transporting ATPase subunit delta